MEIPEGVTKDRYRAELDKEVRESHTLLVKVFENTVSGIVIISIAYD